MLLTSQSVGSFGVNFDEPFEAQARHLRERLANQVTTEKWDDMLGEAHNKAFTVAGAMKADLLADLADAVGKSKGLKQFQEDFKGIVEKHGWDYNGDFDWRTRTIYMTNLRTSYAAGRLEQLQDYPLWMYKHSDLVTNPRQQHKAWSGLVLSSDDPWWQSHYPPNGWGCQCRIIGVRGPKDVKRYKGYMGETPPIKIDPKTGAPQGIDRGWDYMPGYNSNEHYDQIKAKAEKLPPQLKKPLEKDIEEAQAKAKYWDSSTVEGRWHDAAFSNAPEHIKRSIRQASPVPRVIRQKEVANAGPTHIDMDKNDPSTPLGKALWRHEYGHWKDIDLVKGKNQVTWSSGKSFTNAMNSDAKRMIRNSGKVKDSEIELIANKVNAGDREAALKAVVKKSSINFDSYRDWLKTTLVGQLPHGKERFIAETKLLVSMHKSDAQGFIDSLEMVKRNDAGRVVSSRRREAFQTGVGNISDLFGSATLNKVKGGASHTDDYLKVENNPQAECFANSFDLLSHPFGKKILDSFAPEMLRSIQEVLL